MYIAKTGNTAPFIVMDTLILSKGMSSNSCWKIPEIQKDEKIIIIHQTFNYTLQLKYIVGLCVKPINFESNTVMYALLRQL